MATKKSMCVLFGIVVILAWVLGSAIQAGAETMKFNVSNVVTKGERYPVGDVEQHGIVYLMRDGVAVLENGEVGSMKALVDNVHDIVDKFNAQDIVDKRSLTTK